MKKGRYVLSESEYKTYQYRQERPRGAFSEIWSPDDSRGSHKGAVDSQAIGRIEPKKQKKNSFEGLFLQK